MVEMSLILIAFLILMKLKKGHPSFLFISTPVY